MRSFARLLTFTALCCPAVACSALPAQRLVLIDQDAYGPAGSDQMAMIALLQAPGVRVLGITTVTGNAWQPEETAHTLRMLELIHRTDVPVVAGATHPLVHIRAQALADRARYGSYPWYGAWGDLADNTGHSPFHAPNSIPPLREGVPTTHALPGIDAAHFIVQQVHAHPHEVTLYAAGPLTNIAQALSLDPHLPTLTTGIVIMGGSLDPQTKDPGYARYPRHEFNFWFDPEAAHRVLNASWPRIDLTPVDIALKTQFTRALLAQIASSPQPAAQYLARYTTEFYPMWDELAACAWLDPTLITQEQPLPIDVNLTPGPHYGDTVLTNPNAAPPISAPHLVHVQQNLNTSHFYTLFLHLMRSPPRAP